MDQLNSTLFDPIVTEPVEIDFAKAFYFKDEFISLLIKTTHLPTGFKVSKKSQSTRRYCLVVFWLCAEDPPYYFSVTFHLRIPRPFEFFCENSDILTS